MATSSIISRPTPQGWEGRSCHYDGYPHHQGRVLFEAVTCHFAAEVDAARRYFIDDHPAGWSQLGGDFTRLTGYLAAGRTTATSATATATATTRRPRSTPTATGSPAPTTATCSATTP